MASPSELQREHNINAGQLESVLFLASLANTIDGDQSTDDNIQIITTHCAHIVLTTDRAYKIKRSIKYSYLNMLDLNTRELLCKRELEINQPVLPQVYRKVVALRKCPDGSFSFSDDGEVVEWVLIMKRFSENRVLDNMAKNGVLSIEIAKQIGNSIAQYHDKLPSQAVNDGYERMREIVDELIEELTKPSLDFSKSQLDDFAIKGILAVDGCANLLDKRAINGYIKRCHGDLHLRNIVLMGDGPHPFDALEFDERMATTDVLYDLAFVLMDLSHRDLVDQQNTLLNQYLAHCKPVDLEGLALLPLFLFCRAGIKAMTTAQNAGVDSSEEAVQYLNQATAYLAPASPSLIAIGGYSGSGKSTIATKIATRQNAILIASDLERKSQLHMSETQQLPSTSYTKRSAQLNYQHLMDKAQYALSANQNVIVDATFLPTEQRRNIESIAEQTNLPFLGIWLDVPPETMETRINKRRNNASDATLEVLREQLEHPVRELSWNKIDAGDSLSATMTRIENLLDAHAMNSGNRLA